jgi:hypothetical protein
MAVTSATSSISYTGNNSTSTSYAVPFVFLENAHLAATAKVTATGVETVVTLTNHTGAGNVNGGTVRTAVAVPATSTLTIFRIVPATQTTSYQEGGDFPAASHERALDKLTLLTQQAERKANCAIRVTEADGARNEFVAAANTMIGLDGSNQPKAMTLSEVKSYLALTGTTLSVPAGMKTFADAAERALAVPDFTGQLGTQRDTGVVYVSAGTSAGNWTIHTPSFSTQTITSSSNDSFRVNANFGSLKGYGADTTTFVGMVQFNKDADVLLTSEQAIPLIFKTNAVERMRIDASGNVGIGTASPSSRLHVDGTIRYTSRPTAGTITAIGFDANGDLRSSSSSLRYKQNVEPYAKGLAEVAQLDPVTFNYNGEELVNAGLIVEAVDELGLEEFVLRDSEGTADAIPYGNMVALLINAIKELKVRVEELEAAQ